jgi:hypothetical protein
VRKKGANASFSLIVARENLHATVFHRGPHREWHRPDSGSPPSLQLKVIDYEDHDDKRDHSQYDALERGSWHAAIVRETAPGIAG